MLDIVKIHNEKVLCVDLVETHKKIERETTQCFTTVKKHVFYSIFIFYANGLTTILPEDILL